MDEAIGDDLVETVSDTHIRNKEHEVSLEPGSSSMFQSNEMVTPSTNDCSVSRRKLYTDIRDAKDLDRIDSSDDADVNPRCVNGAGVMVKELILKNYDGENLTVVDTSNSEGRTQTRKNQWQHLRQMAGGPEVSDLHGQVGYKENSQAKPSAWEDEDDSFFSLLLDQNKPKPNFDHNAMMDNLRSNGDTVASGVRLNSLGGIRTKNLSKSGFSEYFIKSILGGKSVIHKAGAYAESIMEPQIQDSPKPGTGGLKNFVTPLSPTVQPVSRISHGISESSSGPSSNDNVDRISLREWLEAGQNKENKVGSLHIFRQVLDLVDFCHYQGVSLQELRPSCFKLLESYEIMYLGSFVCDKPSANTSGQLIHQPHHNRNDKKHVHQNVHLLDSQTWKKRKISEGKKYVQRWPQFPSRFGSVSAFKKAPKVDGIDSLDPGNCLDEHNHKTETKDQGIFFADNVSDPSHPFQDSVSCMLEEKWYTSPELFIEMGCTFASNIYNLGVLLFELLCSFGTGRSHAAAMLDLRHRILPPSFLSENPREAGFCLWLLHPEPSLRPTTREVMQSEFISGIQESCGGKLLSSIDEEDGESELLLYFLSSLREQKQKDASVLVELIHDIETDVQEVEERRRKKLQILSSSAPESLTECGSEYSNPSVFLKLSTPSDKETRFMSNARKLESAYISMRSNIQISDGNTAIHRDRELLKARENWCTMGREKGDDADRLGYFFDGFCKFARYNKFKVRGILRNGEFNSFANVICSLSFDRDEDYLAAGLVSKKIKIYEFQALFNDSVDIHYPVVEMANKSNLSCICWNSYVKNYIASTDYEGIVKLWDAGTGQSFTHFIEHSERAWSVDFSRVNPMKLASCGDDRLVKLWSISEKNSLCTIRNHANVCCVQFSADSAHLLACSSADYKTYCYDLRKTSIPWCVLAGHEKTVSYAKFLDAGTLVSASTDNTLKIWDLNKTSSIGLSKDACVLTLRGHTNEKNFVGLSAHDGYITCGSETNEVFAYYRSLSMPITAHKFGSIDSITGKETENSNGQFVSSVCWRRKSDMVVVANSSGCIKLLQMV